MKNEENLDSLIEDLDSLGIGNLLPVNIDWEIERSTKELFEERKAIDSFNKDQSPGNEIIKVNGIHNSEFIQYYLHLRNSELLKFEVQFSYRNNKEAKLIYYKRGIPYKYGLPDIFRFLTLDLISSGPYIIKVLNYLRHKRSLCNRYHKNTGYFLPESEVLRFFQNDPPRIIISNKDIFRI